MIGTGAKVLGNGMEHLSVQGMRELDEPVPLTEVALDVPDRDAIRSLMDGALSRLAIARGHMERGAGAQTARHIRSTMAIIGTLQEALNAEEDTEAVSRLDALYDYIQGQLYHADVRNNPVALDEVVQLLATIRSYEEWLGLHGQGE